MNKIEKAHNILVDMRNLLHPLRGQTSTLSEGDQNQICKVLNLINKIDEIIYFDDLDYEKWSTEIYSARNGNDSNQST